MPARDHNVWICRSVQLILLLLATACVIAAPSGGALDSESEVSGYLLVNPTGLPDDGHLYVALGADGMSRVTITSPPGYRLRSSRPPGTKLGFVNAFLRDVARRSLVVAGGELFIDDPSRYEFDPIAQLCAPGRHAAVWRATMKTATRAKPNDASRTITLAMFIDAGTSGSGVVFRLCPVWPAGAGMGPLAATTLEFWAEKAFGTLETVGHNAWSAMFVPPRARLEPDEPRTFEARALEPIPSHVTLKARHHPERQRVVLTGRVMVAGEPIQGAEVSLGTYRKSSSGGSGVPFSKRVRTDRSGRFVFRRSIRATTTYLALVHFPIRACSSPSTAPAGCVSETIQQPPTASTTVRVPRGQAA